MSVSLTLDEVLPLIPGAVVEGVRLSPKSRVFLPWIRREKKILPFLGIQNISPRFP